MGMIVSEIYGRAVTTGSSLSQIRNLNEMRESRLMMNSILSEFHKHVANWFANRVREGQIRKADDLKVHSIRDVRYKKYVQADIELACKIAMKISDKYAKYGKIDKNWLYREYQTYVLRYADKIIMDIRQILHSAKSRPRRQSSRKA